LQQRGHRGDAPSRVWQHPFVVSALVLLACLAVLSLPRRDSRPGSTATPENQQIAPVPVPDPNAASNLSDAWNDKVTDDLNAIAPALKQLDEELTPAAPLETE
jgi:hypothetical protein